MSKNRLKQAKLIHISFEEKNELDKIKNEIVELKGDVSINQLIRDAIQILIIYYRDSIVKKYIPLRLKEQLNIEKIDDKFYI